MGDGWLAMTDCGEQRPMSPFPTEKFIAAASGLSAIIPDRKPKEELNNTAIHVGHKKCKGTEGLPGSILGNLLLSQ